MSRYEAVLERLAGQPRTWLVTGCAGFIGSHIVERLLTTDQWVVGVDNFVTGNHANLDDVRARVGRAWSRFRLIEGDIADPAICLAACGGVDYVLHQAALGSVPRSIADPWATHSANVDGFIRMLIAARDARVRRFVYASSSSVYGDEPTLPKTEHRTGRPLSPYAVSKAVDEYYATVFHGCFDLGTVGLRYFNVFGPRQDPDGPYAAVIPRWVASLLAGEPCVINGDGETSRDFCYVANAVQANILAATAAEAGVVGEAFNVAVGQRTSLNRLFTLIRDGLAEQHAEITASTPAYGPFRPGDVRHSLADIEKARTRLGYVPSHTLADGLREALGWYAHGSTLPTATAGAAALAG